MTKERREKDRKRPKKMTARRNTAEGWRQDSHGSHIGAPGQELVDQDGV